MALAGDHAQTRRESWREIATQIYAYTLAALSLLLIYVFPPKFDFRIGTIVQVAIVVIFLAAMERPSRTSASNVAPLTALMAASGIIFGAWLLVFAAISGLAIRWRVMRSEGIGSIGQTALKALMQLANSVISSYAVLGAWGGVELLLVRVPHVISGPAMFIGIVLVGLAWQTANNLVVNFYLMINSRPVALSHMLRVGIVASIYAYLLVAMYRFGGLFATTVFYIVVAQIRVIQDVLGMTAQLHKLEKAQDQAQGIVRDMVRFTDTEEVEFSREVQNIAQMIGRRLGMPKSDLESLDLAALLHEMGKSRLPARIRSGANLNAKEQAQKKTYARWGGLMVRAADALLPSRVGDWIEFHGEHFDGTGYPRGLRGEDIPLPSRIIAVSRDYVRFLTGYDGAERVGKEKALALLHDGSGTLYDPRLVGLLTNLVS
ncbi:MAG: HD domain-containing protein [Candidatus Eremiobacteraeota bacterium]|nr:HD domain-containing protein [Candidatus Eremiobacteraeota bacterium]